MWEAGSAENRSGGRVSGRGARSGNTAVRVRCVETAGFRRCIGFFTLPVKGAYAARSGCRQPGGSLVNREHESGTYVDEI